MTTLRAGTVAEIARDAGTWLFVDIGFSSKSKTCGWLVEDGDPTTLMFGELQQKLLHVVQSKGPVVNLVLEAPLSVAFSREGNPVGRSMERQNSAHRYWFEGAGPVTTVAAAYLLSAVRKGACNCEIRLFEAFVSFKPKRTRSSHVEDVLRMRSVAWDVTKHPTSIIAPELLCREGAATLESAFKVFGFDCGIPPVICIAS